MMSENVLKQPTRSILYNSTSLIIEFTSYSIAHHQQQQIDRSLMMMMMMILTWYTDPIITFKIVLRAF